MSNTAPPLKIPEGVTLIHGGNVERGDGKLLCLMEVVALLAGEPHGFHPACTSPALSTMGMEANDLLGNHERQGLLDLAPELVGTACWHCEEERVLASVMRACSVSLGGALRAAGLMLTAQSLEAGRNGCPSRMKDLFRAALQCYGPGPENNLTWAIHLARLSLEDLEGSPSTAAGHSTKAVHYAALVERISPADAMKAHLRAVIAACPHGTTRAAVHGTLGDERGNEG